MTKIYYKTNYYSIKNREETMLDKFIYFQKLKAFELGITNFTNEMNIAFTKILNTCIDAKLRGIDYDFTQDVLDVLLNNVSNKSLSLNYNNKKSPRF